MPPTPKLRPKHSISWHLADLLGKDAWEINQTLKLYEKRCGPRAQARGVAGRVKASRWLAARMMAEGEYKEILDRTEGKVAEPGRSSDRPLLALHIDLGGHSLGTAPMQVIDITPTYQQLPERVSDGEAQPAGELAPVVQVQVGDQVPAVPLSRDSKGEGAGGDGIPLSSSPDTTSILPPEIQQVCENAAKVLADRVAERMAPVFDPPVKRKRGRPRKVKDVAG